MSVRLEEIDHPLAGKCLKLENKSCELIVTLEKGPRVLYYGCKGGENIFAVFEEDFRSGDDRSWHSYGGHRLWHAPEVMPRTYAPDNDPVEYSWNKNSLELICSPEKENGLQKKITLRLDSKSSRVELDHQMINIGPWAVELAGWCLSVMAPGGELIVPQERYIPHPEGLTPARPLVLWHFTDMSDPRFSWGKDFIRMRQDDAYPSKQKFGLWNSKAWAAYRRGEDLFLKTQTLPGKEVYPDYGCNQEFFTMPGFLEIESLSPLTRLEPGESLIHRELWSLRKREKIELEELENLVREQGHPAGI